jgi:hypothetical protein
MRNITANEIRLVLHILKNPSENHNANNISKQIGISSMGALKIAKILKKEGILVSRQIGKGIYYSINLQNPYCKRYLLFILKKESEDSAPYIKRWISDIIKIKNSDLTILYGSVLSKHDKANDIDILFLVSQKNFEDLKKEIEQINKLNTKKIHPLFQSKQDIIENIKKQDKIILNAIKGVIITGEEIFLEVLENEPGKK